jgi:glycosyltransferase involved in cell wall biosynthesis
MVGPSPLTVLNYIDSRLAAQLAGVLAQGQFDVVQLEGVLLSEYLGVIRSAKSRPAVLIDWHNIDSELMCRYAETTDNYFKKLAAKRTAELLVRAENQLLDKYAVHTVPSERERQKVMTRRPKADIRVVPNGIDTTFYSPRKLAAVGDKVGGCNSKPTILFVGSMDYHANIDAVTWFLRTAWPEIARSHPDLQFTIVGRDPSSAVLALAEGRVRVTGTVEDVRPFYASAVAVVVPLRCGSGTRLKILEAMSAGVPVVSTRLGAEGIDVENNVHILLADTAREIAAAIGVLLASADMRAALSAAARDLALARYDWSIIGKQLYKIHCDLVGQRQQLPLEAIGSRQ